MCKLLGAFWAGEFLISYSGNDGLQKKAILSIWTESASIFGRKMRQFILRLRSRSFNGDLYRFWLFITACMATFGIDHPGRKQAWRGERMELDSRKKSR